MNALSVDSSLEKVYLLAHQNVCITNIDFTLRKLVGYTELLFVPLRLTKVTTVKLNAKQCQIIRLLAKGSTKYYNCDFTFNDPLLEVVTADASQNPIEGGPPVQPERSLKKFSSRHQEAVVCSDTDIGNGEVIINLPEEVKKEICDGSTFKIFIEYVIDKPQGGLQFVVPEDGQAENITDLSKRLSPKALATSPQANEQPSRVENSPSETPMETSPAAMSNQTPTPSRSPAKILDNHSPNIESPTIKDVAEPDEPEPEPGPEVGLEPEPKSEAQLENSEQIENKTEGPASPDATPNPDGQISEAKEEPEQPAKTAKSKYSQLFTYKNHNSSRLWFPCLDSYGQPCSWLLEFTVESHLTVISCGDLIGTHFSPDKRFKTYRYELNVPTAAPNIGFAAGQFETWVNPDSPSTNFPIKNYFLNGLRRLIGPSCGFLRECADFYKELLNFDYPYTVYKQVFVDQAYEPCQSYATFSICDTNLLFSKHIIDQAFETRSVLAEALAAQLFGCFISMSSWSSSWLTRGISMFVAAQYKRRVFGNNDYRYNVQETMKKLIEYEQKHGGIVLDESSSVINKSKSSFHFSTQNPHTISPFYNAIHQLKAFLVIRMLEDRIGRSLLIQVYNKILSLALNASQQPASMNMWGNMLISTVNFDKAVFAVTGKDKEIASFLEHWVYQGGHAKFNGIFTFDRKRNVVELNIKQSDTGSTGVKPYFGPITVTVQELDGTFPQKLNIEENKTTPFVITCHSKSRRNKKKKIPLCTGEEVDMDLSMMDSHDSPVLWIRIDPDMQILRQIVFEQPDYNWQYQLKYERDVTAQIDSLQVLMNHPTVATRKTLTEVIEDERCFYKVRCRAALNLTKIANEMAIATTCGNWQAPTSMINIHKRFFGSTSCPNIIKLNNYSLTNLQTYFLQKTIPRALAGLRVPPHRICPPEVLKFILDMFKYNDNSKNAFSDNYYRASLIEALAETVTPVVVPLFNNSMQATTYDQLPSETKLVAEEITRSLNMEKILPCYKYVVTISCLSAIKQLQRLGHLPSNPSLFRSYTAPGVFIDVRCAAVKQLVDIIRVEHGYLDLEFLLNLVQNDEVPAFRYYILEQLFRNPPPSVHSYPNSNKLKEQLWSLMNSTFAHDSRLRCATADVFQKLFGKSDKSGLAYGHAGDINHKPKKKKKKKDKDKDKEKKKSKKTKDNPKLFLSHVTPQ